MYMAYTTNPHLPTIRARAVRLYREGQSLRQVARYTGYHYATISKWVAKSPLSGVNEIPTQSSRPRHHPRELASETVRAIVAQRLQHGRCAEVVHEELRARDIVVSLSSVKRTLERQRLVRKRSPWKRYHAPLERPQAQKPGDLVQMDTIHLMATPASRIYVYTLLDVYSRWAYAWAVERINAVQSVQFLKRARGRAPFSFRMLQSDHGPEFSMHFTERAKIAHRHSRVRRPNDNAHLERFNGTLQQELLRSLPTDVRSINQALPAWIAYYNGERLHLG